VGEILFSSTLDRTFIVRIESYTPHSVGANTAAQFSVSTCSNSSGFVEEEVKQFVGNSEVGGLLELLERSEADEHFKEGEGGFDGGERSRLGGVLRERRRSVLRGGWD
jgi:hypothetical protein